MLKFILSGALLNKMTICFTYKQDNKIKLVVLWGHDTNISSILNSHWQIYKYKDKLNTMFSDQSNQACSNEKKITLTTTIMQYVSKKY